MVIEFIQGGPLISIPKKLQKFYNKYSDKFNMKIQLYNQCPPSPGGPTGWLGPIQHHNDPNYYCFECRDGCKETKLQKDLNFVNNFLYIRISFVSEKDHNFSSMNQKSNDKKETKKEIKMYWKEGILDAIENIIKISGMNKESFIRENIEYFITTEETKDFYKNQIKIVYEDTGKYKYFFDLKYLDEFINQLENEL